jgi:4-hydroxybutyrate dehydrogenase
MAGSSASPAASRRSSRADDRRDRRRGRARGAPDARDGRKLGFISPHLIPRRAICDPELTLGLPPALTAATGLDALSHCVETFLSPRLNPPADAIALDGAGRIWRALPLAHADGRSSPRAS